jgi:GNAT superfamily N-acetyltransferase
MELPSSRAEPACLLSYASAQRSACIGICAGNVPGHFTAADVEDFVRFLASTRDPYFVLVCAGRPVGCGGIYLKRPGVAALSWGMVDARHQRTGFGTALLRGRLAEIRRTLDVRTVVLNTAPAACPFFARHGFTVSEVRRDGHGAGMDLVVMSLDLARVSPAPR